MVLDYILQSPAVVTYNRIEITLRPVLGFCKRNKLLVGKMDIHEKKSNFCSEFDRLAEPSVRLVPYALLRRVKRHQLAYLAVQPDLVHAELAADALDLHLHIRLGEFRDAFQVYLDETYAAGSPEPADLLREPEQVRVLPDPPESSRDADRVKRFFCFFHTDPLPIPFP